MDYVQKAIDLAKAVTEDEEEAGKISFDQGDILAKEMSSPCLKRQYDVCLDKGTYDAISLSPENPGDKRKAYQDNLFKLMKDDGLFIITSCNWTLEELKSQFEVDEHFQLVDKIPSPTFQFGGKVGNRETSLIFMKVNPIQVNTKP